MNRMLMVLLCLAATTATVFQPDANTVRMVNQSATAVDMQLVIIH